MRNTIIEMGWGPSPEQGRLEPNGKRKKEESRKENMCHRTPGLVIQEHSPGREQQYPWEEIMTKKTL